MDFIRNYFSLMVLLNTAATLATPRYRHIHRSMLARNAIELSLSSVVFRSEAPHSLIHCSSMCADNQSCRSFFHVIPTGYCQLHDVILSELSQPSAKAGSYYYVMDADTVGCDKAQEIECHNLSTSGTKVGATAVYTCLRTSEEFRQTCAPNGIWTGDTPVCECDCKDLFNIGVHENGVYPITIPMRGRQLVFCDMEQNEGGWTVLQCRLNNDLVFDKSHGNYNHMFGEPSSSYWLGLTDMNRLTPTASTDVILSFRIKPGNTQHTLRYSNFMVSGSYKNFSLTVSDYIPESTWEDVFSAQAGQSFTTGWDDYDLDEDVNCANEIGGGWWYKQCYSFSLNGLNASIEKPSASQSF